MERDAVSNIRLLPQALPAQNLPTQVQNVLFDAILTGMLAPGERLLVDEIAEHFGISKIPVREALKALEVSGWVQSLPRRGTYVTPLTWTELRQAFEMRRVIEPYIARRAAERRSEAHLVELEQLVLDGMEAIRRGDIVATTAINSRFHSVIAQTVDNTMLGDTVRDLEFRLRRYFVAVEWQQRRESISQAIFEAIRDRDAARAERLTLEHLDHTESLAHESVARHLEPADAASSEFSLNQAPNP